MFTKSSKVGLVKICSINCRTFRDKDGGFEAKSSFLYRLHCGGGAAMTAERVRCNVCHVEKSFHCEGVDFLL
jgi:hypothetical protein